MAETGTLSREEKDGVEGGSGGATRSSRAKKRFSRLPGPLGFVAVYFVVFSALTMYRHEVYSSARSDLGNMDQAVWNTSEGRFLESPNEQGENRSRLANHADFL